MISASHIEHECSHICKGFFLESTYFAQGQELIFFQNTLLHMPIRRETETTEPVTAALPPQTKHDRRLRHEVILLPAFRDDLVLKG